MARIRTVKPTIWGDARFASLSRDARLLAIGLISNADDAGRFIANPTWIAGTVFPHDDLNIKTVQRWRDEIVACGLIQLYRVGGREYGWFPKWAKHQRINRPQPSTLPPPPDGPGGTHSVNGSVNGSLPDSLNDSPPYAVNDSPPDKERRGVLKKSSAAAAAEGNAPVRDAAAAARPYDDAISQLQAACTAQGLPVRWDKLGPDQREQVRALVAEHGVNRLASAAKAQHRPDSPAGFANAWLPAWQALPPPGRRLAAVPEMCPQPDHALQPMPCRLCAADAKAVG